MSNRFTEKAESALNRAVKIAEGYGHTYIGSEHILAALSEDRSSCASMLLHKNGVTKEKIDAQIRELSGVGMRSRLNSKDTTPRFRRVLEGSYRISKKFLSEKIGSEHILMALIEEKDSVAMKILYKVCQDMISLRESVISFLKSTTTAASYAAEEREIPIPTLLKYGKNMTAKAGRGDYDPLIGRDKELNRLIRILTRKNKNNPCLIGEAGVGKTAIVEGLAQRIASGNVPPSLIGKIIISVDLTSMVAGAKYRGDFEERIKSMLDEAARNKSVILFIDEVHTIVGAGSAEGAIDAANIMKPELSRGEIRLIGATTIHEYRKYIEKDSALERRFQPLMIEEPTKEEALNILRGVKENYEKHHKININDEALKAAISLSERYIQDRFLPDKALDLLDEACASLSNSRLLINQNNSNADEKAKQYYSFEEMLTGENATNLMLQRECEFPVSSKVPLFTKSAYTDAPTLSEADVRSVVSELYGIKEFECQQISAKSLKAKLNERIIGQDSAVCALAFSVMRSSVGISSKNRPRGIFLFLGESGVGKTELAKALSEALFNTDDSLIRYDMSEYGEPYSVSKLIGSAPGYVGYDDMNGALEKIRRHPYSVILLDEIEKAHQDVLALFLQIFDTGILTDASGRKINFRNSYIVMTSNIGADKFKDKGGVGFLQDEEKNSIRTKLKGHFKDEFINRIDDIVLFSALDENSLTDIARMELEKIKLRLEEIGMKISFTPSIAPHIAKLGSEKGFGARPLLRIIATEIENKLADAIASGELSKGCEALLGVKDEEIYIESFGDEQGSPLNLKEALI